MSHSVRLKGIADFVSFGKSNRQSISFPESGLTKQSFRDDTDVNLILAKYQRTGVLDFVEKREGQYGDALPVDFQTSLDTVIAANQMFADLPSSLRKRFGNSPVEFVEFCSDPANRDEGVKLGLFNAPPVLPPSDDSLIEPTPPVVDF